MHGLVNRSIQSFLRDTYGAAFWARVAEAAGLPEDGFETMQRYDDALTDRVIDMAAGLLDRHAPPMLEDLGTYLVSDPRRERLRRLLRLGGAGFVDFLHSLEDLPERARLALPDLDLPQLCLNEPEPGRFMLACRAAHPGFQHVLVGMLRAMADDYGALVVIDTAGRADGADRISIDLLDQSYTRGKQFELAAGMAAGL